MPQARPLSFSLSGKSLASQLPNGTSQWGRCWFQDPLSLTVACGSVTEQQLWVTWWSPGTPQSSFQICKDDLCCSEMVGSESAVSHLLSGSLSLVILTSELPIVPGL